jgi:hypothetical protein
METIKAMDMFGNQPFFNIVLKTVQPLVTKYDEIFQALAVERLPKPFQDLGFDGVIRWKSPASEMFFSVCQTRGSPRWPSCSCTVMVKIQSPS